MKMNIGWTRILTFIVICGGLIYITESYLMTIGILLLLFVAYDFVLKKAESEKQKNKENETVD